MVSTLATSGKIYVPNAFETTFEVDKEVVGAMKVAFFRLAHLQSSSIKDIFNVNDACKRESIKLDENVVKLKND